MFRGNKDRWVYLRYLEEAISGHGCELHAYVLMTNHVHLLVTPANSESLPRAVASAQEAGRKYINVASHLLAGAQRKRNA